MKTNGLTTNFGANEIFKWVHEGTGTRRLRTLKHGCNSTYDYFMNNETGSSQAAGFQKKTNRKFLPHQPVVLGSNVRARLKH